MAMEKRNEIIQECIEKIKRISSPRCHDHTPYYGACVSCGYSGDYNPNTLPDLENVVEELETLKST